MKNKFMSRAIELSIESVNNGGGPFGGGIGGTSSVPAPAGGSGAISGTNATANTGGGGGAGAGNQGGKSGGSGIVIIRYKYQN